MLFKVYSAAYSEVLCLSEELEEGNYSFVYKIQEQGRISKSPVIWLLYTAEVKELLHINFPS